MLKINTAGIGFLEVWSKFRLLYQMYDMRQSRSYPKRVVLCEVYAIHGVVDRIS